MRILYVLRGVEYYTAHATVIPHLCENGHQVRVLFDEQFSTGRSFRTLESGIKQWPELLSGGTFTCRSDGWRKTLFASRELLSYAGYLNRKDQSQYYLERWEGYLVSTFRNVVHNSKLARRVVGSSVFQSVLQGYERMVPPDAKIIRWMREFKPDVVMASPLNMRHSEEIEYIKAARALRIPTITLVYSWDNLTTKGMYHIIPDVVLAWNQVQSSEAEKIHHVRAQDIVITGSPTFDGWFGADYLSMAREPFCARVGLDPQRPFVLYLGSSSHIAEDETWLVRQLSAAIKNSEDSEVRGIQILARPHPANVDIYSQIDEPDLLRVWPVGRNVRDTIEFRQDFYNSLSHSVGTLGINTSGMIDAIINDRPGATIMAERYRATQMQTAHFRQLIQAKVLEVASDIPECVEIIKKFAQGWDRKTNERRQFVKEFIRPRGLHFSAGEVVARAIELAGAGKTAAQINTALDSEILES